MSGFDVPLKSLFWTLLFVLPGLTAALANKPQKLALTLRVRKAMQAGSGDVEVVQEAAEWEARNTAMIVCDMWDQHWCAGAAQRVDELTPVMDRVIRTARDKGVFIIHAPSATMLFYEGTPPRQRARSAPTVPAPASITTWQKLDLTKEGPLPIDDSDGGCDDMPPCPHGAPWTRQHAAITIADEDAISDDGAEIYNLLQQHAIENVLVMGVHTNMCVLGRPFSIRQLVGLGKNVVLMRDMTDAMYNSRCPPFVPHSRGTELVIEHIETYWCPTVTSDQIVGGQAFQFRER